MTHKTKIIIGIIALVLVSSVIYVEYPKQNEGPLACTMEAKICPDGSGVGRTGPNCEFAECPAVATTTTAKIGQKITSDGVSVTPTEVVEDSRCPIDVQCIQAGTVRVKVKLESAAGTQEATIGLSSPVTFAGKRVSLVSVLPVSKTSGKVVAASEYRFTFSVTDAAAQASGTLKGSVTVGPVCPVETPGYPCTPTPEMYAAAQVFVYLMDKTTLVKAIIPDAKGNFSVSLPAGKYFVDMIHQTIGGTTGVPTTITIKSGQSVTLKLTVDTGLR